MTKSEFHVLNDVLSAVLTDSLRASSGIASMLPGVNLMIEIMAACRDRMTLELAALQGTAALANGHKVRRPKTGRGRLPADPEARSREYKRRQAERKPKRKNSMWDGLSFRQRKEHIAKMQRGKEAAARKRARLERAA